MKYQKELKEYIENNITLLIHPYDDLKSYRFSQELQYLIDYLIFFLDFETDDDDIKRVGNDFSYFFETIYKLSIPNISDAALALEGLAGKLEGFLKKMAFINPNNRIFWKDDNDIDIQGIRYTMLDDLLNGKILKKRGVRGNKLIPDPLIKYDNDTQEILDFVRNDFRNAVHYAKENKNLLLIAKYSNIVIGSFLLAIESNIDMLKNVFFKTDTHFDKILTLFTDINQSYIELEGKETTLVYNDDISPFLAEYIDTTKEEDILVPDEDSETLIQGKIIDIVKSSKKIVIRGNAGSGKTTILRYLSYFNAHEKELLPFYFELKNFDKNRDIIEQVSVAYKYDKVTLEKALEKELAVIYFDGLDEIINRDTFDNFRRQFLSLLSKYEKAKIILTSRPYFEDYFSLKVFDILPLTFEQITNFLEKNLLKQDLKNSFLDKIRTNNQLLTLCENVFYLHRYVYVVNTINTIPENTGLLLFEFTNSLYKHELAKPNRQLIKKELEKFKILMCNISYSLKRDGISSFNTEYSAREAQKLNLNLDYIDCINFFTEINIVSGESSFTFTHPLYQDFFIANWFFKNVLHDFSIIEKYLSDNIWFESLSIFYGLTSNIDLIKFYAANNPLLAAETILKSIKLDKEVKKIVIDYAYKFAKKIDDVSLALNGLLALIRLRENNLISSVVSNYSWSNVKHKRLIREIVNTADDEQIAKILEVFTKNKNSKITTYLLNSLLQKKRYIHSSNILNDIAKQMFNLDWKIQLRLLAYLSEEILKLEPITLDFLKDAIAKSLSPKGKSTTDKYYILTAKKYNLFSDKELVNILSKRRSTYSAKTVVEIIDNTDINKSDIIKEVFYNVENSVIPNWLYRKYRALIIKDVIEKRLIYHLIEKSNSQLTKIAIFLNKESNSINNIELIKYLINTQNPINIKFARQLIKEYQIDNAYISDYFVSDNLKVIQYFSNNFNTNKIYPLKDICATVFKATGGNIKEVYLIQNKKEWIKFLTKNQIVEKLNDNEYLIKKHLSEDITEEIIKN